MPRLTPQQAAEKLGQRIAGSGGAYQQGVQSVSENPAQKAIANKDKWVAGIQDAINNDRYAKGLAGVTLADWKNATLTYGVNRYTSSSQKATTNYQKFAAEFFPFLDTVQQEIDNMPSLTLEDNINRMVTNVRRLHEFKNR